MNTDDRFNYITMLENQLKAREEDILSLRTSRDEWQRRWCKENANLDRVVAGTVLEQFKRERDIAVVALTAAERVLDADPFESGGTLAERITQHLRNFDVWFKACKRQDARVAVLERDRQTAETRALAAERECDRWRHGQPIEGDYVCPNELKLKAAMAFVEAYDYWNHLPTDKQEPEALTAMNTARNALAALEEE